MAFDLDGTLYHGGRALPGARHAVSAARAAGLDVVYVTNASGRTRAEVGAALRALGIAAEPEDVWTSAAATAEWLRRHDTASADVLGAAALVADIRQVGVVARRLRADGDDLDRRGPVDALVIGLDPRRDPDSDLCLPGGLRNDVAGGRTELIACNRDLFFPGPDGSPQPGCGVVVARVEAACGREVDAVVGKPGTFMLELAAARLGLRPQEILVVGDSVESDVGMARAARAPWVLVAARGIAAGVEEMVGVPGGLIVPDLAALPALYGDASPVAGG